MQAEPSGVRAGSIVDQLELFSAYFPASANGNPERKGNQTQVEREGLSWNIEPVVSKLASARNVARGVDLRDARQSGPHAAAGLEPGYHFECLEAAVCAGFDLSRTQGSRAHKAHVSAENVPQL